MMKVLKTCPQIMKLYDVIESANVNPLSNYTFFAICAVYMYMQILAPG